jgi:hypothetical protein
MLWRVAVMPKGFPVWSAPVKQEGHENFDLCLEGWERGKDGLREGNLRWVGVGDSDNLRTEEASRFTRSEYEYSDSWNNY